MNHGSLWIGVGLYLVLFAMACSGSSPKEDKRVFAKPSSRIYQVLEATSPPSMTGETPGSSWSQAEVLEDFVLPWQEKDPPYTAFQGLYDKDFFYFRFEVEDPDIVLIEDPDTSFAIVASDRVELFFAANDSLDPYYQLEMDPRTRVFDAKSQLYRKVDQTWIWQGMQTFSTLTDQGYLLSGRIPMSSFHALGLWQNEEQSLLLCGVFRAEFEYVQSDSVARNWISWIVPESPTPDFHIPSAFGHFEFK